MSEKTSTYENLVTELKELALLRSCGAVLGWDEQTNLPPHGAEHRANQLAMISGLSHERGTSSELGEMLNELSDPSTVGGEETVAFANVRDARRAYDRTVKLPKKLVEELTRATTLSQHAWVESRKKKDFSLFQPWLEKIINLKRTDLLGYHSLYFLIIISFSDDSTREK